MRFERVKGLACIAEEYQKKKLYYKRRLREPMKFFDLPIFINDL